MCLYRGARGNYHIGSTASMMETVSQKWQTYRTIFPASLCPSTTMTCLICLNKQQVYQSITDVKQQTAYYLLIFCYSCIQYMLVNRDSSVLASIFWDHLDPIKCNACSNVPTGISNQSGTSLGLSKPQITSLILKETKLARKNKHIF